MRDSQLSRILSLRAHGCDPFAKPLCTRPCTPKERCGCAQQGSQCKRQHLPRPPQEQKGHAIAARSSPNNCRMFLHDMFITPASKTRSDEPPERDTDQQFLFSFEHIPTIADQLLEWTLSGHHAIPLGATLLHQMKTESNTTMLPSQFWLVLSFDSFFSV